MGKILMNELRRVQEHLILACHQASPCTPANIAKAMYRALADPDMESVVQKAEEALIRELEYDLAWLDRRFQEFRRA